MRIHSGRQCGKPSLSSRAEKGRRGVMWKCVPSAITCLLTKKNNKKNNQWKIQYGQKYFKTTNILEDFHLRVCQMRKNFICCSHVPARIPECLSSPQGGRQGGRPLAWMPFRRPNNDGLGVPHASELATGNSRNAFLVQQQQ